MDLTWVFIDCGFTREMEQGFLNKSNKDTMRNSDNTGSVLSDLAKRVKSINGKLLGKDGKPLKPYRCVNDKVVSNSLAEDMAPSSGVVDDDAAVKVSYRCVYDSVDESAVAMDNNKVYESVVAAAGPGVNTTADCMFGGSKSASMIMETINVAAGTTMDESTTPPICVGSITKGNQTHIDNSTLEGGVDLSLADVVIPREEVDSISARLKNSLYGYFVGQRPAFPVVQNFVRNVWRKFGFMHVMIHKGFFIFQFSTKEGMDNVLNFGSWRIRSVPLILKVWNPNSDLIRDEVKKVPVWVKLFNVPIVAYSKVGLDLITAKLGRILMLDEHTSNMCLKSWGMNSYARVLVEISAVNEFVKSLVVAIPIAKTKEHRFVTIDIEFEYTPPRCSMCKVFDHVDKECHKKG